MNEVDELGVECDHKSKIPLGHCCMNVPLLYGEGILVGLNVVEDT
jgi:hypothetical protein